MQQEDILNHCRFCNSYKIKLSFKKEDIYIFRCLNCKIVFLGNNLDDKCIRDLYGYYGSDVFLDSTSSITKLRYEKLLDNFERHREKNAIIDIGCGAGYFMVSAAIRGWHVDGTEISEEAIKLVEKKGQRVICGDITSLELEKDKYDVATLFEFIEHTAEPENTIRRVKYIVRPGGLIYITTPNYNSITRRLLGNRWGIFHKEHFFYFTTKNLTDLLNKYDFKVKKAETKNLSLREVLKIFRISKPVDDAEICERQEYLRDLTDKRIVFSVLKKFINIILNMFRIGDTIYILAERQR